MLHELRIASYETETDAWILGYCPCGWVKERRGLYAVDDWLPEAYSAHVPFDSAPWWAFDEYPRAEITD